MNPRKAKLTALTVLALVLVLFAGFKLKTQPDMAKGYLIAWGLVFTTACISFVRGVTTIGKS